MITAAVALVTLAIVLVVAAPKEAESGAEPSAMDPPTCTFVLDTEAGLVRGSCGGSLVATFSGPVVDGVASGDLRVTTHLGPLDGTFEGAGFNTGSATATWSATTWWGSFSGRFTATPAR